VPSNLLVHHRREDEIPALPKLARGWRDRAGPVMLEAEAKRRITDVIPLDEQIASLHEVQDFIVKYGTDVAKWPVEARNRKAEIDQKLNYIHEVRARASAHSKAVPANPVSDKIWPTRLRQGWTENR
jgi:thioesterase domain-containing protein